MSISPKQRLALIVFQDYECEVCRLNGLKKKYLVEELEIHRIKGGIEGGDYVNHRNLMVLCSKHHNILSSALRKSIGVTS